MTLIHEVGHAVGLDHPFGGTFTETGSPGKSFQDTVMSYDLYSTNEKINYWGNEDGGKKAVFPQSFMIDDIAVLQYMYGVNEMTNSSDTTYDMSNLSSGSVSNGLIYQSIWDAGGVDTISWDSQTSIANINLNPGEHSFFGEITSISDTDFENKDNALGVGDGILGIAYGSLIENAIGGKGPDVIVGNSAANVLYGGAGANVSDTLTGGAGADIFKINVTDGTSNISASPDIIMDFKAGIDVIEITNTTIENIQWAASSADPKDTVVKIIGSDSELFLLDNVAPADLSSANFTFKTESFDILAGDIFIV